MRLIGKEEEKREEDIVQQVTQFLSEEQIAELKVAFDMFDKDGDGCVTVEELKTVMRSLGQNPTDRDIDEMTNGNIKHGDGNIDFVQFIEMLANFSASSNGTSEEEIREAFKAFDKDGNGFISADEISSIMSKLGEHLSENEIKEMIEMADTDGDGMNLWT
ncbi:DgyrCDS3936 [Dimorphilus gyrociliatus]|uniref:DgyrCDS3936 n=1 Tax=Dimorphilus gyrociliatus TaxID=2664684 RepID=A0A7I8VGS5_9ANNE|nr:DgyrCDS3936 [Dimorphilus gyrociliatus]